MSSKKISLYNSFLHVALVGLTLVTVLLMNQNRELRGATGPRPKVSPAAGDLLQPIEARSLDGHDVEVAFASSDRATMLLVFTTTCPACKQNLSNWLVLWERFRDHYDFVGISIDSIEATRSYVQEHSLPFEVLVPAEPAEFSSRYRIAGVPETIQVERNSRVAKVWLGALPEDFLEELDHESVSISKLSDGREF